MFLEGTDFYFSPPRGFLFVSIERKEIHYMGSGLENGRGVREQRNLVGASSMGGHITENEILTV